MANLAVHFTSARTTGEEQRDVWATPRELFDALREEFDLVLDAACNEDNCLCVGGYPVERYDALEEDWAAWLRGYGRAVARREDGGAVWCNPPYSNLGAWIAKAREESDRGATVVMLIPARTDTRAWHDHIFAGSHNPAEWRAEVRFLRGRLKFGSATNSAPFPSAVVIFRPPVTR